MTAPIVARLDTVVPLMTADEAHATESEIIKTGDRLRVLLVEFNERQGYRALGYSSYTAWAEVIAPRVFGASRVRLTRELTAAVIERELVPMGTNLAVVPERQLRPLAAFVDRPRGPGADEKPIEVNGEAIRAAWHEANERSNGNPTARVVEQVVREMLDPENDELDPPMELEQIADQFPDDLTTTDKQLLRTSAPRMNAGMYSSETPEWYTPVAIIDRVIDLFETIDLDPCSNSQDWREANVPAECYYTKADDGLAQQWHGKVYMNPPYGDEVGAWVDRLVKAKESQEIDAAIALLPARTETDWFAPLLDYPICFVHGRLKFSGSKTSAPFPSVVVYLGANAQAFYDCFHAIGPILVPFVEVSR